MIDRKFEHRRRALQLLLPIFDLLVQNVLLGGTALVIALAGLLAWPETRRELRQVLASGRLSLSQS